MDLIHFTTPLSGHLIYWLANEVMQMATTLKDIILIITERKIKFKHYKACYVSKSPGDKMNLELLSVLTK